MNKNLILNVKKRYFDVIKSGDKNIEYRQVKDFWIKRICNKQFNNVIIVHGYPKTRDATNSIVFPWNGFTINGGWFEIKLDGDRVFPSPTEQDKVLEHVDEILKHEWENANYLDNPYRDDRHMVISRIRNTIAIYRKELRTAQEQP